MTSSIPRWFFAVLFLPFLCFSQQEIDFSTYRPSLHCQGVIPEELLRSHAENAQEQEQAYTDFYNDNDDLEERKTELIAVTALNMGTLYRSGQILFGDRLSVYANEVKDEVLKSAPELRDKVDIYILRSTIVNAFATLNGNVYLSLGLIARLKDEAQLASIIAHEAGHVQLDHLMNMVQMAEDMERLEEERGQLSTDDILTLRSRRSKDQEHESDSISLHFLQQSAYAEKSFVTAMEILSLVHIPLGDYRLDLDDFKMGEFALPHVYYLDEVNTVEPMLTYEQRFTSHPNIGERIERGKGAIADSSGAHFVLKDAASFREIVKESQFALVDLHMINRNYAEALYLSLSLLEQHPDNTFLKMSHLRALYGLAKYQNHRALSYAFSGYSEVQGEAQRLYYLLKYLNAKQLSTIITGQMMDYLETHPDDSFMDYLARDLVQDLVVSQKVSWDDFLPMEDARKEDLALREKAAAYEDKASARRIMGIFKNNYTTGFGHLKNNARLNTLFTKAHHYADSLDRFDRLSMERKNEIYEAMREKKEEGSIVIPAGTRLIIADPKVLFSYKRSKVDKAFEDNLEVEAELKTRLAEFNANQQRSEAAFVADLRPSDVEEYNRMSGLGMVFNECFNQVRNVEMIPTSLYANHTTQNTYYLQISSIRPRKGSCYFSLRMVDMRSGKVKFRYFTKIGSSTGRLIRELDDQLERIVFL